MFYCYILQSLKDKTFYIGSTSDLKKRIKQHNNGEVKSTNPYKPFDIIYYEACLNIKDAYKREKYLKSRLGKNYLKKRLKDWINEKTLISKNIPNVDVNSQGQESSIKTIKSNKKLI